MAVSDYRKILFHLSEQITSDELKKLKYLCIDFIPTSKLERITQAMDLFTELEYQEKLSDTNFSLLKDLLKQLERRNLLSLIDKFSRGHSEYFTVGRKNGRVPRSEGKLATSSAVKDWHWEQLVTDSDERHRLLSPAGERLTPDQRTRREEGLCSLSLHIFTFLCKIEGGTIFDELVIF